MALEDEIYLVCKVFGRHLAKELKTSFDNAVKKGAKRGGRVQEPAMHFTETINVTGKGIRIKVLASGDYWINVEKGRGKGKKMPPEKAIGKKWMAAVGINPRKVLTEIQLKSKLGKGKQRLKKSKKALSFDKAVKQLSFLIRRGIKRDGIKAKPFRDRVIYDGRLESLSKTLSQLVGKQLTASFSSK